MDVDVFKISREGARYCGLYFVLFLFFKCLIYDGNQKESDKYYKFLSHDFS